MYTIGWYRYSINNELRVDLDSKKAALNIKKHGVSFEKAAHVFLDSNFLLKADSCQKEERWNVIGLVDTVLFVVFAERSGSVIRIISARKATKEEIHEYSKHDIG